MGERNLLGGSGVAPGKAKQRSHEKGKDRGSSRGPGGRN